ncbi:MAG TPA: hypothetical protein VFE62_10910 [Gemmataceae bacterium]|nr:hypothetical protein [Gemmataceae bacterium]
MSEYLQQVLDTRAIRGFRAAVGIKQASRCVENEVASELQNVLFFMRPPGQPAAQHQLQITKDHAEAQERRPRCSLQAEGTIRDTCGVCDNRKRQRLLANKGRQQLDACLSDDEDIGANAPNLVIAFLHLDQVRPAGDSKQVPEEDQKQGFTGVCRERGRGAVR